MRTLHRINSVRLASIAPSLLLLSSLTAWTVRASAQQDARPEAKPTAGENEQNQKIAAANAVVARTFKAGNEALEAGRYDEAIAAYDEGIATREEVALFTNRSEALRRRGVARYNAALGNKDAAAKQSGIDAAYQDWRDAAESARRAIALDDAEARTAESAPGLSPPQRLMLRAQRAPNRRAALAVHAAALGLVASKVDHAQADTAAAAYAAYITATADPAQKRKLQLDSAKMLFDAGAIDRAIRDCRTILAADRNNATASFYLGYWLFSTADKAHFQEAANCLGSFVARAPATDPNKADAQSILDYLKNQEKIVPKGVAPTGIAPNGATGAGGADAAPRPPNPARVGRTDYVLCGASSRRDAHY